jgi:hypothetical protein
MSVIAKENKDLCPSEVGDLAGLFISSDPALITRARSAIGTGQPGRACFIGREEGSISLSSYYAHIFLIPRSTNSTESEQSPNSKLQRS